MNRKPLMGALLIASASLLATGAYAQNNNAAPPGKANAAKAEKADKADKADKAEEKGKLTDGVDRAARKAKEHTVLKEQLQAQLKGAALDEAMKQEIRRHAERVAKLERIKAVATTEKDTATADKVTALLTKENARHDKWMEKHGETAATPVKEGAK